jgi:trimeric autotransporter adhesin
MTRKLPTFPGLCIFVALILSCAVEAGAQSAQVPARITLPIDDTSLVTLHGNTHPLARAEFDQGAAPASLPMKRMLLILQRSPDQESALGQLLQQQQDNSSPSYHKWLTPQQFGAQFGPAPQDIQAITTWLESQGFHVAGASQGGILIEFSGAAEQVQRAFHTLDSQIRGQWRGALRQRQRPDAAGRLGS